jgi:hypothetical protein
MSSAEDLNRKAKEVGQHIRALMSRRGMDHHALGEALGITRV